MAAEGEESFREGSRTPTGPSSVSARRSPSWGIVIHLTGTEGEWDSLEDDELVFPLDHGDNSVPKDTLLPAEDQRGCQVPPSPSSTGSLGLLRPGPSPSNPRPPFGLVKSMSTELEPKDSSTLGPRPFLSLVKSISTELSRSEPEVAQSKSDSRLNLHLLKQLTQSRTRTGTWTSGDSRTAPPSPSGEGQRGGFFKAELEDTRRKLSEAVQEPLSCMFSRILGEEGGGSPRHPGGGNPWNPGGSTGGGSPRHQAGSRQSSCRSLEGEGSVDMASSESPVRTARGADDEDPLVFDWPSVRQRGSCPVHGQRQRPVEETLDPDGDGIKAEVCGVGPIRRLPKSSAEAPPPISLFCVAVLSYGYLVLPLGPYVSGLALGVALGFLLGLLLIRVGSSGSAAVRQPPPTPLGDAGGAISGESDGLKGWMNEIEDYDPESCHPALTHSVFASLEGSSLRLDYPRSSISRRAAYDDKIQEVTFIKSRRVQLANSKVSLLPAALARKRVWNPKYPICIQLAAGDEEGAGPAENLEPGAESASCGPQVLYLFGRTGREKEEWFRLLQLASRTTEGEEDEPGPSRTSGRSGHPSQDLPVPRSRGPSSDEDNPSSPPAPGVPAAPPSATRGLPALDYHGYMARLLAADRPTPPFSAEPSPTVRADCTCDDITSPEAGSPAWVNALIGRIFWDFLREKHWADVVSRKIQKKLSKIRLPCFMNELTLTELDMGRALPQVLAASRPAVDRRGLWVELQLLYTGNLQMSLQTRFNLSKLGKEGQETAACAMETRRPSCRPVLSVLADSEEESSSAASSDEEEPLPSEPHCAAGEKGSAPGPEGTGGGKTGRKILRFVDKIAKSKCFQRAAENEFIKKKFEEMSNTPLLLSVEVQELAGTLVVNIPAPPTDRIWYSFRGPPKLDLHVCPKLGQRELSFCQVTEWIERKLQEEFQKVFVLPNMDDVFVPLMNSEMDRLSQASSERVHPEAGGTSTSSA